MKKALVILACAAACTPSRGDIVSWSRVRLEALQERLQKISGSLPPPGQVALYAGHPPVEPLPRWGLSFETGINTDLLMADALAHPRWQHGDADFRLPSFHLERVLSLLAPGEDGAKAEKDEHFRDEVKHVLQLRYVVVARVAGKSLEAYVVDLATGAIRAAVSVDLRSPSETTRALSEALHQATGGEFGSF